MFGILVHYFYRASAGIACEARDIVTALPSVCPSVRPSVLPSNSGIVSRWMHTIVTLFLRSGRGIILVFFLNPSAVTSSGVVQKLTSTFARHLKAQLFRSTLTFFRNNDALICISASKLSAAAYSIRKHHSEHFYASLHSIRGG